VSVQIITGDCIESMRGMADQSVHCCITSPPYFGLRDYGVEGQIGLESSPAEFVAKLVDVFREVRRVLRDDGTLWLNLGDSYARPLAKGGSGPGGKNREWYGENYGDAGGAGVPAGPKPKDLIGIPWRVAFALQADGWYLRQDIIWAKPNPMPESVTDRCTKAHEYIFLLAKSERYYFDQGAIKDPTTDPEYRTVGKIRPTAEGGEGFEIRGGLHSQPGGRVSRNRRSVWSVSPAQFSEAHFATFPPKLIEPCILAGCPEGGTVLDPFSGSGTTGLVSIQHQRKYIGIELNPEYVAMSNRRLTAASAQGKLFGATA